jgi:hypothetical protein
VNYTIYEQQSDGTWASIGTYPGTLAQCQTYLTGLTGGTYMATYIDAEGCMVNVWP